MKRVTVSRVRNRLSRPAQPIETAEDRNFLGPAALIEGETASAYDKLYAAARSAIKPKDCIDEILVRDVVDLALEVARLRRTKANLVKARMPRGMETVLRNVCDLDRAEKLARQWAAGEREGTSKVKRYLASMGLDLEAVAGEAMCADIRDIEAIDRMTMSAEQRRNLALREIEHRRWGLGAALRRTSDDIIEGRYKDVSNAARGERSVQ